jgi:CDP-diacylglycerol---serine O-phosphatidyltransferase
MNIISRNLPNALTCMNLLCGSLAVMLAFGGTASLVLVSALVIMGAVFDFLDGAAARMQGSYSPMGKELDSLADLISFGLAPAAVLFVYSKQAIAADQYYMSQMEAFGNLLLVLSPFVVVIFSALRLAKFNVDTRQSEDFIGLPTPANALFIISFPLIIESGSNPLLEQVIINKYTIAALSVVLSGLLVSEIKMFSLKFKSLSFAANRTRFIFIGAAIVLLALFHESAVPLIIMLYVLVSILSQILCNKKD